MDVVFIEEPYPDGPFGAKGIGEPSLISVPTAVALAAGNACGQFPDRIPVTPETILRWTK
jgi:CO/xanthine dehydrogenase Mo-binding subunit